MTLPPLATRLSLLWWVLRLTSQQVQQSQPDLRHRKSKKSVRPRALPHGLGRDPRRQAKLPHAWEYHRREDAPNRPVVRRMRRLQRDHESEKGEESNKRDKQSEKGEESNKRDKQSEKGKESNKRDKQSEKGEESNKRDKQSEKGEESSRTGYRARGE
eukprot:765205-Hanusia_phi.AAC.3